MQSMIVTKQRADGKYNITAVSTAALSDYENETFTTKAMDYDIALATKSGIYPEFRVFHKKELAFGEVTSMKRVGIFAIDSGISFDDPFSLEICEKMLVDNSDGKWKVSRGFNALEVAGGCPECGENLVVNTKHMMAGYRCPTCGTVNLMYKGILKDVQFLKARTFDVTVTDVPAVPWTGVSASLIEGMEEFKMKRDELKQKLLDAGLKEELIESRLKQLSDDDVAAFSDIPDAEVLKEFEEGEKEEPEVEKKEGEEEAKEDPADEQVLVLDPEVLADFGEVVKAVVKEVVTEQFSELISESVEKSLSGIEIDLEGIDFELKEIDSVMELKEAVLAMKKVVDSLATSEEERLKEILDKTSPAGKLRITRHKAAPKLDDDEEVEDSTEAILKDLESSIDVDSGVIIGSDGSLSKSMTDFVTGGGEK
jgi:formiminotetrahydrofolate cyclodeaminase